MMMQALFEHLEATAEDIVFSADLHAQVDAQGQRTSSFRGATLPAQLRRLTSLETSSSSEIWSFLLMAQRYTASADILLFLIERIRMSPSEASSFLEGHKSESGFNLSTPRNVYGSDAYRISTLDKLEEMKTSDPSAALACHLLRLREGREDSCEEAAICILSVRVAVMLFLDVWLASFADDFLPRKVDTVEDDDCDDGSHSSRSYEVLDLLISLVLEISRCDELLLLGVNIADDNPLSATASVSTRGPCSHDNLQDQPFKSFFPTLFSFLRFHSLSLVERCSTPRIQINNGDGIRRAGFSVDMLSALAKLSLTQRMSYVSSSSEYQTLVSESVDSVIDEGSLFVLRQQFLLQLDRSLLAPLRANIDTYAMLAATLSIAEISRFTTDVETSADTVHEIRRVFSRPIDKMYIQLPEHLKSIVDDNDFLLNSVIVADTTSSLDSCGDEKLLEVEIPTSDSEKDEFLLKHLQSTADDSECLSSSDGLLQNTISSDYRDGENILEKSSVKNSDVFVDFFPSEVTDSFQCDKIHTGEDDEILNDEEATASSRHVNSTKLQKLLGCTNDELAALVNKESHAQQHVGAKTAKIQQILGCSIDELSMSSRNSLEDRSPRNTDILSAVIKQTSVFTGVFGGASRRKTNLDEAKPAVITEKSIKEMEALQKGSMRQTSWRPGHFINKFFRSPKRRDSISSNSTTQTDYLDIDDISPVSKMITDFSIEHVAEALSLRLHYLFSTIPLAELTLDLGFPKYGSFSDSKVPHLDRFRLESERIQYILINEILCRDSLEGCAETIIYLIGIADMCLTQHSHHVLVLIVMALKSTAVFQLTPAWDIVKDSVESTWTKLESLVGSSGSALVNELVDRVLESHMVEDVAQILHIRIPRPIVSEASTKGSTCWLQRLSENDMSNFFVKILGESEKLYFKHTRFRRGKTDESLGCQVENFDFSKLPVHGPSCQRWQLFTTRKSRRDGLKISGLVREETRSLLGKSLPVARFLVNSKSDDTKPTALFPYVNGFMRGLINLNVVPDYIKEASANSEESIPFCVSSPGMFSTDPLLPVMNMGKIRSVAIYISVLRCCQLFPYEFVVNTDIQLFLQKKLQFPDEESQWNRSEMLLAKHKRRPTAATRRSLGRFQGDNANRNASLSASSPKSASASGLRLSPLASTGTLHLGKL